MKNPNEIKLETVLGGIWHKQEDGSYASSAPQEAAKAIKNALKTRGYFASVEPKDDYFEVTIEGSVVDAICRMSHSKIAQLRQNIDAAIQRQVAF